MRRVHFEITDSTNTRARDLWDEIWGGGDIEPAPLAPSFDASDVGEPLLVTAAEQSAGRGRRGRAWHSPRGGAWFSLAWPMRREAAWYAGASVAAAVAVRRAVADVVNRSAKQTSARRHEEASRPSEVEIKVKWPNDLLIDDRKVAGILCEQFVSSSGAAARSVVASRLTGVLVVGEGFNVDFDVELLGPQDQLRHPATTLSAAVGRRIGVNSIIESVSRRLVEGLQDYEKLGLSGSVLGELREHLAYVGMLRRWSSSRGVVAGLVLGVDEAGRLLMETEGRVQAIEVGEIGGNDLMTNDQ
jgi:BirA family biotin operon repressor/biotin-[acetyl-CoA-carboxylase] ligase